MSTLTPPARPLRIGLFGAGSRGAQCLAALKGDARFEIVCVFDNDPKKWGTTLNGITISQPTAAACAAVDTIVMASVYAREIIAQLANLGCTTRLVLSPTDLIRRTSATDEGADTAGGSGHPGADARLQGTLLAETPQHVVAMADRIDRDPPPRPLRSTAWSDETACTICCNNYFAHAIVLARSFLRQHPGGRFFIALADRRTPNVPYPEDPRIRVIAAEELAIAGFDTLVFKYDVLEFNTAIKPFLLEYLFRTEGVRRLLYLDPDILILESLSPLFERLDRAPMVLTPHLRRPYTDDKHPREVDIMRSGTFNLGFIGLAAHDQTWAFLAWWQQRLFNNGCSRDADKGYFTDQKWIDFVPSFFPAHEVVREPGYNAAYWNLHERTIAHAADGRFLANDRPLYFFHFSGIEVQDLDCVSKHQNRHTLPQDGALRDLFELYRLLLLRHGHLSLRGIPYAYARFDNGVRIPDIVRITYRESGLSDAFPHPHRASGASLFEWLRAPSRPGRSITNLQATLHARTPDLRREFPDPYGVNQAGFLLYMTAASDLYGLPMELSGADVVPSPSRPAPPPDAGDRRTARPMRGVNVIGYLKSETGMGEGGRSVIRALQQRGYPVARTVLENRDTARQGDHSVSSVPGGAPHAVSVFFANADQADVIHAELGPAFYAGRYNIGVWLWELDTLPASLHRFDVYDEIWASSRFIQQAIAAVSPIPVVTVPLSVTPPPAPSESMRARFGLPDDRALFLFAFDALSVIPRKNPFAIVDAFRRAFGSSSREACLAIKASRLDAFPAEHRALADAVQSVGGRLIDTYLDRQRLSGLFHACDAYVSLHRSEGFGLTMAEAMAMGKPVIATGYSGNMDFMTSENSYPVRFGLTPLDRAYGPYPAGAVWAEPDVDHAAALMRAIVDDPEGARARGRRAAADLAASHSPAAVGELLTTRLEAIYDTRLTGCAV